MKFRNKEVLRTQKVKCLIPSEHIIEQRFVENSVIVQLVNNMESYWLIIAYLSMHS